MFPLIPVLIFIPLPPCSPCLVLCFRRYYSIDNIFHMCGECCIDPKNEWIFKIFEPGLTLAKDLTPCQENGYPFYNSTVTHGVAPISMTLDLYVKSN